jgi:hypothetical protein
MSVGDWVGALGFVALPILVLVLAGSSNLPDPLQHLLDSPGPARDANSDRGDPLSPERFPEYLRAAAILVACSGFAYVLARLVQGRSRKS